MPKKVEPPLLLWFDPQGRPTNVDEFTRLAKALNDLDLQPQRGTVYADEHGVRIEWEPLVLVEWATDDEDDGGLTPIATDV